jgi:plastocyanin
MRLLSLRTLPLWLCFFTSLPVLAAEHHVTVGGTDYVGGYYYPSMRFAPAQLTIQAGDTVIFDNAGGSHNVAANDGSFRCAQGCDNTGGNGNPSNAGWSASVTFDTPGTVTYHCEVHGNMGMTGTITVEGTVPTTFNLNQHGLAGSWANPATDSQGVVMDLFPDLYGQGLGLLFGGWFTFDMTAPGGQRWYTLQGQVSNDDDTAVIPIYQTLGGAFDTGQATTTTPVGQATIHFDDCSHGSLAYAFTDGSGRTGTIPLTRLLNNLACTPTGTTPGNAGNYLVGGTWADVGNSGQGLVFDVNTAQGVLFAAWYSFLANAAANAGAPGQHWYTLQAAPPANFTTLENVGIYDTTGGVFDQHATTTTTQVGTATLVFNSCSSLTMTYTFTAGPNAGISGTLDLSRIAPVPAGCSL